MLVALHKTLNGCEITNSSSDISVSHVTHSLINFSTEGKFHALEFYKFIQDRAY